MMRMMFGRVLALVVPAMRKEKRVRQKSDRSMRGGEAYRTIADLTGDAIRNSQGSKQARPIVSGCRDIMPGWNFCRLLPGRLEVGEEVILVALGELLEFRKAGGVVFGQVGGFPGVIREIDQ
jgi:hypothetical protein